MLNSFQTKTARFGSGAVILQARQNEGLTIDQIEAQTPAVFAQSKHESRSERYTFIDSREVMLGLMQNGFAPFEVRQGGSRDEVKRGFTKHMIRMRHASVTALAAADPRGVGRAIPEVILLNAHDGTSSYKMLAGIFATVCTNGLICGEAFEELRIGHTGNVAHKVIEGAFRVIEDFPRAIGSMDHMAQVDLNRDEQRALALAARELRWEPTEGDKPKVAPIEPEALLERRRPADQRADLWTTFNVVQENLMNGGQRYTHNDPETGRRVARRTVRAVNGIDQNRSLNRALWTLAEEMAKIKAA